jgi:hypothetical protein
MVHEAWHAWEAENGGGFNTMCGHQFCPGDGHLTAGFCVAGFECDTWTPHGLGAIGSMRDLLHHPYPAETEFLCDVANTPAELVPLMVRELAAADADVFAVTDIVNGPMPGCFGVKLGVQTPVCSDMTLTACDQTHPCASPLVCDLSTGCCEEQPGGLNPILVAGAFETQTGPDICTTVLGFMPNEPVDIQYENVPFGGAVPLDRGIHQVDATGFLHFVDPLFDQTTYNCPPSIEFGGKMTITVTGQLSNLSVSDLVPDSYFCDTAHGGESFGDCP